MRNAFIYLLKSYTPPVPKFRGTTVVRCCETSCCSAYTRHWASL